jgi:hypothetical protein
MLLTFLAWGGRKVNSLESEIFERVCKIENLLASGIEQLHQDLNAGKEGREFLEAGLKAYREKCLRELNAKPDPTATIWARIRNAPEIRFPHRKIIECLAARYDFQSKAFEEIHFSKLVKEACVGKNKAKEYLALLEVKGLIASRTDGYRKFFRIAANEPVTGSSSKNDKFQG